MTIEQKTGRQEERQQVDTVPLTRAIGFGLIGGLVATIVMDLFIIGILSMMGMPADVFFFTIGNSAGTFFSGMGMPVGGGVPLGVTLHYLIGPVLGLIFGAAVSRVDALRLDTTRKGVLLGIIAIEVASLPLLVFAAIVLKMTGPEALQWFGISFVSHVIFGTVLGGVVRFGLRSRTRSIGV